LKKLLLIKQNYNIYNKKLFTIVVFLGIIKSIYKRIIKTYNFYKLQKSCILYYYKAIKQKINIIVKKTRIIQV